MHDPAHTIMMPYCAVLALRHAIFFVMKWRFYPLTHGCFDAGFTYTQGRKERIMHVTQKQIAELLGLSQMTVHKALCGHPKISQKTRQRVLAMAEKLGYRRNTAAATMRTGKTSVVSLLLSTILHRSILPQTFLFHLQHELQNHGYALQLEQLPDHTLNDRQALPHALQEWRSDAILINYHSEIPPLMKTILTSQDIPFLWLNSDQPHDAVYPDDKAAAALLCHTLIAMGHRHIVYCDTTRQTHYSSLAREAGYTSAMKDAGLVPRRIGSFPTKEKHILQQELHQVLTAEPKPTAFIAYSPEEAVHLLHATILHAPSPEDRPLVTTFAAQPLTLLDVPLPTMIFPYAKMARHAVEMLLQKLADVHTKLPSRKVSFHLHVPEQT